VVGAASPWSAGQFPAELAAPAGHVQHHRPRPAELSAENLPGHASLTVQPGASVVEGRAAIPPHATS
jgi:hypothetical protein